MYIFITYIQFSILLNFCSTYPAHCRQWNSLTSTIIKAFPFKTLGSKIHRSLSETRVYPSFLAESHQRIRPILDPIIILNEASPLVNDALVTVHSPSLTDQVASPPLYNRSNVIVACLTLIEEDANHVGPQARVASTRFGCHPEVFANRSPCSKRGEGKRLVPRPVRVSTGEIQVVVS